MKYLLITLFNALFLLSSFSQGEAVLKIGLVADPQYADKSSSGTRFYRESLWKLEEAMDTFNAYHVDLVQNLGDIIDAGWTSYDSILPIYEKLDADIEVYHLLGNHDFSIDSGHMNALPGRLSMPDYHYSYAENGWRFIVLDATDYAYHSSELHDHDIKQVDHYYEYAKDRPNYHRWNGAMGLAQQEWLKQELHSASLLDQKVILFSHLPIGPYSDAHNLWNDYEIADIIENSPSVVAFINGHNHAGAYASRSGIHYITVSGMVEGMINSYGILEIYNDSLVLQGYGNQETLHLNTAQAKHKSAVSPEEGSEVSFTNLKENFQKPLRASGVNCWWWWLNGNVNKEAITRDLEAMKARNFHGAMIFDAGGHNQRGNRDIPKGPLFGSEAWNELFVFALDEAERLGLEMGFNIQSGWNLGGPRVTPTYAAKQITYSEREISGNRKVQITLELPEIRKGFYEDIAVLAIPVDPGNKIKEGISDLDLKLGYHELGGSAPDTRFLLENSPRSNRNRKTKASYLVKSEDVLELTEHMDAEGKLEWEAPEGNWKIIRFGYTCTDAHVSTSSGDWQGNVLDYMSKEAFDFYWKDVVEPIFMAAGRHVGTTLTFMETDSWECGGMNWTDLFPEEFARYRGYELMNYLPIVAGYVVDDLETSNGFLADFRKTLGDLVAYNHYAYFQEYAHKYDMGIQPESAGPHAGPLDGMKNYGFSDLVMSEFWSPSPHRPHPPNRFYLKQASSAAHVYGIKIVGAESFTTIGPHWNDELWHDQKSAFDHEICAGLNRMYFHTFTCSPSEMGLPGQEYFAGTHVNPQVTWWEQSGAFIDYMHRVQSIVQEGKFVADVLYYYGDHVPNVFPYKHADPAGALPGFDYDVCDETIFLDLEVEKGNLLVPGGIRYQVLVLPDHRVLSLSVLEKLEKLLLEGATVLGHKPEKLISMVGGTHAHKRFRELSEKIWGDDSSANGEKTYGTGKVVWGITARDYLLSKHIAPDFHVEESQNKADFDYIHYTIGNADIYFVSNQTTERQVINAQFRVSGKQPVLCDALSGEIRKASAFSQNEGCTKVPLSLEPYASVLVVFDEQIAESRKGADSRNYSDFVTLTEIKGPWTVNFDPRWGGPASILFPELTDWTRHRNEGIKYYSGPAVYDKSFHLDFKLEKGEQYFLQLGSVKDVGIAEVKINGTDKGVLWTAPFRVDISEVLTEGENTLEITVVNSWYNRVAGDQTFPGKKQYTNTNINLKHDFRGRPINSISLEPSGLLGPVTIQRAR